jgi:hypothetical protein
MNFAERCHLHNAATNKWLKRHPWYSILLILVATVGGGLLMVNAPIIIMVLFVAFAIYTMATMVGDSAYKSKTGWYDKHRCEKCGQFVEPKDDQ